MYGAAISEGNDVRGGRARDRRTEACAHGGQREHNHEREHETAASRSEERPEDLSIRRWLYQRSNSRLAPRDADDAGPEGPAYRPAPRASR